ncbi:MAG: hypothetical protein ACE5F1_11150 [Planctomycetota bacterium]
MDALEGAPEKQLKGLEALIIGLRRRYAIRRLLLHREVARAGDPTVCPGDHLVPLVEKLRRKPGIPGPAR